MDKSNARFYRGGASALCVASLVLLLSGLNQQAGAVDVPPPGISAGTQLDDAVVSTKVRSALLVNEEIKGFDIKVTTRKGEVMLSGFVDNQSLIDRSLAIVQGVEGVKSIDNKLMLKEGDQTIGNKLDDGVVTAKVKAALLRDAAVKSQDIAVLTRKGVVQLSGFVDSDDQIARATTITMAVEGVQKVSNQMSIKK